MALSDLAVFSEYAYLSRTEFLNQNLELFNAATQGGIVLKSGSNQGDYSDTTFWKKLATARRRNAYSNAAIAQATPQMGQMASVKVAAGSKELQFDEASLRWIKQNPKEQAVIFGQQLAQETFLDYLKTGISAYIAAIGAQAGLVNDASSATATWGAYVDGAALFGDQNSRIQCWVIHSKPYFDLLKGNLTNAAHLFSYANVNVTSDPQGRPMIITDIAPLFVSGTPNKYWSLGLTPGAIVIEDNGDYDSNEVRLNGKEQILTSWQAEWTFQLSLKGFSWDKTNGGHSPNDAAIATATNWDVVPTDTIKDMAGVMVRTQ